MNAVVVLLVVIGIVGIFSYAKDMNKKVVEEETKQFAITCIRDIALKQIEAGMQVDVDKIKEVINLELQEEEQE